MADEHDPEPRSSAEVTALEARVARLEVELAALQRQISTAGVAEPVVARAAPAPPPRPPQVPFTAGPGHTASGARPLVSEAWASAPPRPPAASQSDSRDSFESQLGSQIFNRIAIVLLLIGTAYFFKLAVDRRWIVPSPAGRVIAGLIAGAGLVLWSERFRHKGFAAFSYSLKAVGSGVLYLSLWAAFQYFHLLPAAAALGLMVLVTAWNAYMAWVQDSELLAVYALAGGFATPMLVSTGGNHEVFLFTYLLAIDVAIVALVRLKMWPRLLLGAFPLTVAYFCGWYSEFYAASELATTSIFIALFGVAFGSVAVGRAGAGADSAGPRSGSLAMVMKGILLPLANAAFVALTYYSVLQDAGHHDLLPWLMIVLAAVYLGLMRMPQTRTASAIHLSLAVVFLTIAIPLKASGAWITVSWLVEGLALLWVAARLARSGSEEVADADLGTDLRAAQASRILRPLALASLLLGFCGICTHIVLLNDLVVLPLLNKGSGSAITGIAVFAVAAWLALGVGASAKEQRLEWDRVAICAFVLIDLAAALLTMRELIASWDWAASHPPFQTADFVAALIGLGVFAGVIAVSFRVARAQPEVEFWVGWAAVSTIAFNLIAVLTGVREIVAIWGSSAATAEGALQQALAISAFLMLYGAVLLAGGFWKRSGFLRWQALVLLVFTIFKTFLYDMRNLSQGYRVVSILGLGALLMAISFAYQKDWLNLRETQAPSGDSVHSGAAKDADPEAVK